MEKNVYDLNLHECMAIHKSGNDTITALRVPGGWIYEFSSVGSNELVFVPFNNDLQY